MSARTANAGDANLAIHVGGHFFELAGTFIKELPDDVQQRKTFLNHPKNIGRFIPAATNLALAVELLLKGLAMKTKGRAIRRHKLIDLFNDLPKWVQDEIKLRYCYRFDRRNKAKFYPIVFIISTLNQPPAEVEMNVRTLNGPDEKDVCMLLEWEKDAFQTWRYVYEQAPAAGDVGVTVHMWHLALLVNAIKDVLTPPDQRP